MKRIALTIGAGALCASAAFAHEVLHGDHASHTHGVDCGHTAIEHAGHVDYLHDGHLHNGHAGHVDEHFIEVSSGNPESHDLASLVTTDDHVHDHEGEEHAKVQHGTHFDFVHDGRLHHVHGDHTDDHGSVRLI